MNISRRHILAIVATAAVAAAYVGYGQRRPVLEFRDRSSPPGFRELVLAPVVSPFDPMAGLSQAPPTAKPDRVQICDALYRDPNSPVSGTGAVPIATFLDYRCPYCKILAGIITAMPSDAARIVFHEWAILGGPSVLAARAALAADRQGKYIALHNRLMNARLIPTLPYIDAVAGELGLNVPRLHADMNSPGISQALQRTAALAAAFGFVGTPSLVVGRTVVQGEISRRQLEQLIAHEAQAGPQNPC